MHPHPGCPVASSREASGQRCALIVTVGDRARGTLFFGGRKGLVGLSYCGAVERSNGFSYREELP